MPALRQNRHPTLVAEFGTPGDARAAIEALENHGIDGLEVALLDRPEAERQRQRADRRAITYITGRVAKGVAIGAVVGAALLGIVGSAFVAAAGWPVGAIPAVMIAGIGLGAAVGAFWSVERGVGLSEDWEKTFQEPTDAPHPMRIAVYTPARSDTERARAVLQDHRPRDVQTQS